MKVLESRGEGRFPTLAAGFSLLFWILGVRDDGGLSAPPMQGQEAVITENQFFEEQVRQTATQRSRRVAREAPVQISEIDRIPMSAGVESLWIGDRNNGESTINLVRIQFLRKIDQCGDPPIFVTIYSSDHKK